MRVLEAEMFVRVAGTWTFGRDDVQPRGAQVVTGWMDVILPYLNLEIRNIY